MFKEIYSFKNLLFALVGRQLALRYRGSTLGFLWSFLNPLLLMLIYTLVFSYYIRFQSDEISNYSLFVFCGLLPWIWTTSSLTEACSSIVSSGHLITKAMFPAQLLPLVSVSTGFVHFLLSIPLLILFIIFSGSGFTINLLYFPIIVVINFIFLFGLSLSLASLNVVYRDVQHILGNLLNLLFFLSPIVYPVSSIPEQFQILIDLNPFALFTEAYQRIFVFDQVITLTSIVYLSAWAALALVIGIAIYRSLHETFAEAL